MCTCIHIGGAAALFAKTKGPPASQENVLFVLFVLSCHFVGDAIGTYTHMHTHTRTHIHTYAHTHTHTPCTHRKHDHTHALMVYQESQHPATEEQVARWSVQKVLKRVGNNLLVRLDGLWEDSEIPIAGNEHFAALIGIGFGPSDSEEEKDND